MKTITLLLLCSIITTNLLAQPTEIKGARLLKTVSSLPGKSLTEVRSILKKDGMKDMAHEKNEELATDNYDFYPENTDDKDDEAIYMVGCKNGTVVYAVIAYDYEEEGRTFTNDIAEMKKQLERAGFALKEKKERGDFQYFMYQLPGKNTGAVIIVDSVMASFSLMLGDAKYATMAAALQ
jgi:hypothetical protein